MEGVKYSPKTGYVHKWWDRSAMELWGLWAGDFLTEDEAIAHALWQVRLQLPGKARSSVLKYISLRDHFVKLHRGAGAKLAIAQEKCWQCEGTGIEPGRKRKKCEKCGGSKIYKTYPLYLHPLMIRGQPFIVQSSVEPLTLMQFDETREFYDVRIPPTLPFGGILRALSYYACAKWGLSYYNGGYHEKTNSIPKRASKQAARGGKG